MQSRPEKTRKEEGNEEEDDEEEEDDAEKGDEEACGYGSSVQQTSRASISSVSLSVCL